MEVYSSRIFVRRRVVRDRGRWRRFRFPRGDGKSRVPDEIRKDDESKEPAASGDGAFKVEVPADLLEEAVEAVDRRVEQGKHPQEADDGPSAMQQDEPADGKPAIETS